MWNFDLVVAITTRGLQKLGKIIILIATLKNRVRIWNSYSSVTSSSGGKFTLKINSKNAKNCLLEECHSSYSILIFIKLASAADASVIQFWWEFDIVLMIFAKGRGKKYRKMKKNAKWLGNLNFSMLPNSCIRQISFKLQSLINYLFGNFQWKFHGDVSKTLKL